MGIQVGSAVADGYSIRPFGRSPRFEILRNGSLIGDVWGEGEAVAATHEDARLRKIAEGFASQKVAR